MWLKPCAARSAGERVGVDRVLVQVAIGAIQADGDAVEEPLPGGRVREALEVGQRHAVGLGQAPAAGVRAGGGTRRRERRSECGAHERERSGDGRCRLPRGGRPRSPRRASGAPIPASPTRSASWPPRAPAARAAPSTVKPQRPSSAMSSPWGRWNSTEPSLHSKRRMPNCGRASASPDGSSSSCMVSMHQRRVGEEPEPTAGSQETGRLGNPRLGIAPQAGAVLRDRDVEGVVGQRHRLGAALDEREVESVLGLQRASGGELLRRDVDAHRARPAARQPGRDVGRAAAELDHVAPVDLGQRVQARLGDRPRAPGDHVVRPVAAPGGLVLSGLDTPGDPVGPRVIAEAHAD